MTQPGLAVLAAVGFRLAYAVYDVPHNAMLKRLSHRTDSVVVLSAVRFVTGGASAFAVAGLAGWLVHDRAQGLPVLAVVTAVVAGASMALYAPVIALRSPGAFLVSATIPSAEREAPAWTSAVLLLLMVALLGAVMGGLVTKSLAFIADVDLAQSAWLGRALAIVTAGRLAAAPLWAWGARRIGVLPATASSFGVVAAGGAVVAASVGSTLTLEIGVGLLGAGFAGVTVCSWALLPDLSASLAQRTLRDPIHLTVASYTALNKVALGVSGGIMAALLGRAGTADERPLASATGLFLAAGGLVCVVALAGYLRMRRGAGSAVGEEGAEETGRRRADDAREGAELR